jgi:hypothetical protein
LLQLLQPLGGSSHFIAVDFIPAVDEERETKLFCESGKFLWGDR